MLRRLTVLTGLLFVTFVAISVWAYSRRRKKDFDAAARIPFDEDTESQDEPGERHG